VSDSVLRLDHLSCRFGGLLALDDVTIEFETGRITGLIGPNGAGKTTLFNLVTGFIRPTTGAVYLDGDLITGRKPHEIARAGLGRTFQQTRIFLKLSLVENAVLALPQVSDRIGRAALVGAETRKAWEEQAMENLKFVGLAEDARRPAASLGYGEQKLAMFACLLSSGASTLLLDEPTAGIDPAARRRILDTVVRLREIGKTIVLIEHNLDVVRGSCDSVVFLAEGRVLTVGTAAEIEADPRLTLLYFGGRPRA
jgi:branched-chain amino acid transport system permease protein